MKKNPHYFAARAMCSLLLATSALAGAQPIAIETAQYEHTQDVDDRDAGPARTAAAACETGQPTLYIRDPELGCAIASDEALKTRRYHDALRLAAIGCERYRNAGDCRRAARVPLHMGNEATSVPRHFANRIRRLGEFVCFSGTRVHQPFSGDGTGRECANFARHFVLAKDPEYRHALTTEARAYFEAAHDPALAVRFHECACRRWQQRASCGQARLAAAEVREHWAPMRAPPATSPAAGSGAVGALMARRSAPRP